MKKLAVIGGKGMLGTDLNATASKLGYEVKIYDLPEFDITDTAQVAHVFSSADCVVNCAAYTAVDKAESEIGLSHAVNAKALSILGAEALKTDKYLVHISTDFVFGDASEKALSEDDKTFPLNIYGETKLEGERLLAKTGCRHAVIRIQWTYGKNGANFITKIVELAEKLDSLKVVSDQIGSPTCTEDVAKAICCFLEKEQEGLFHFAAKGYTSRFEVAEFIVKKLGLNTSVSPCSSDEFPTPAQRPLNSRFDCSKIDNVLDFERPEWQNALGAFLNARFSL